MYKNNLSASMQIIGNYIVFTPFSADYIAVYNINNDIVEYVEIDEPSENSGVKYSPNEKFYTSYKYGRCVYFFGWKYPGIIEFNVDTFEAKYICEWVELVREAKGFNSNNSFFNEGVVFFDESLYLPIGCLNGLYVFDLRKKNWEVIVLNGCDQGFWGMARYNENLYLTGINEGLFRFDLVDRSITHVKTPNGMSYRAPICCGNRVLFYRDNMKAYFFHPETEQWEHASIVNKAIHNGDSIANGKYKDGILTISTKKEMTWFKIECKTNHIENAVYVIADKIFLDQCWKVKCKIFDQTRIFNEGDIYLEEFLSYVGS